LEEILIVAVQLLVEVILQVFAYLPFELPLIRNEKTGERIGCGWYFLYLFAGGVSGRLSLLVEPHLMIDIVAFRIANLLIGPFVAGVVSFGIAAWRKSSGAAVCPKTHFWTGFCFVLAFSAIRLAYAAK
jgi:hypothetical protein